MYCLQPALFPPTAFQTTSRPSICRRSVQEANHMSQVLAPSSVMFGGAWLISPLLPSAILVTQPHALSTSDAGSTTMPLLALHATTATRPRSPRPSTTTWKWSLSSGRTAGKWTGSLPCLPCIHAERHGMRSCPPPRALSATGSLDPQTELSLPAGLFIQILQVHLRPPSVTTCFPSPYSHSSHTPAYLPQLPPLQ